MVKRATLSVLVMLLLFGLFVTNLTEAKAQTASPSQAVITVSGVPTGTQGLAVEVTVDTAVVTLISATSDVSGALVVTGSMSEGVGIINASGDLPASFTITVPLTGAAAGTSALSVGMVLDMLGGTEIVGASASVDVSSVTVASSSSTSSSSTSSSTGGPGGTLSADTITVTVNGDSVNSTNALNVTLSFSDSTVATLDTGVTFMGTGAAQLLTDVNTQTNVLTAVWDGTITDGAAVLTAMLKPGTMAGTTTIAVTKVEAAGGLDITESVASTVSPSSVTNSSPGGSTDLGTFTFVGPSAVTGPGKAAISFSATGAPSNLTATLNGSKVDFVGDKSVGIAIIDVTSSDVALSLVVKSGSDSATVDLGTLSVTAGSGKAPKVTSASAKNKSTGTTLSIKGKKFNKTSTTVEIVPTDKSSSAVKVSGRAVKATYGSSDCIPSGSYVNVTTPGGVSSKKIKVKGSCSNPLVE